MCVFVYEVDNTSEPAISRKPMTFTEVYLGKVRTDDFRKNPRGELGTRTATLHKEGIEKLIRQIPPFPFRSFSCCSGEYSTRPYGGSVTTA